jgi:uncharacterized protein YbjQ (UPF0145 family)
LPLRRRARPDAETARAAADAQQASIQALASGGLPIRAEQRLTAPGAPYASDLSVAELAVGKRFGVTPLAQVMGSSVYHVGWQRQPGSSWLTQGGSQELSTLSEAWNEARRLAFDRLLREAALVGASTVVGLDIGVGAHDWMAGAVEYVVFGTAVRETEIADEPVLTNLSLQDYAKLRQAGYRPAGLFGSSGVFYVVSSWSQQNAQTGWGRWANQELPDFTRGIYEAREVVIGRTSAAARTTGAVGLVGVSLSHDVREVEIGGVGGRRTDLIVTTHALGTAIAAGVSPGAAAAPRIALDLQLSSSKDHLLGGAR